MDIKTKDVYFGFIGKLLKVDLTKKSIVTEAIDQEIGKEFMGGAGYACRYLYDYLTEDTDPLSENNTIMIMTGPFCGTNAPSFGRFVICAKSPYTQLWGESNCGGYFGPELKKAGYDGVIITGKAESPVIIKVIDDNVEILDATGLWGKGIKETQSILKNDWTQQSRIICIGPAGENLVKYANVNNEGRSAGRTGMGAVFGSKNLKAIVVKGSAKKPEIAKPDKFKESVKKTLKAILDAKATQALRGFGTSGIVIPAYSDGDMPIKYWSQGEWDEIFKISGEKLKENLLIKTRSCYGCSIGCGRIIEIEGKKSLYAECEGPEYETIAGFGSMILNSNLESIAIANNICNNYGFDTISASGAIALLYDQYNKGNIKKEDVDGLELNWGNSDSLLELIRKIPKREGIGDLIAEGSNAIGERFNIPKDQIATVNRLELPYHDPRFCYGLAIAYAFSPRGACHMTADPQKALRKSNEVDFSVLGIKKTDMSSNSKQLTDYTIKLQDYRALYSSLISCMFSNPPPEYIAELIENLLGIPFGIKEIKITGERIFTIKRLFNIKMGLTSNDDNIPKILLTPVKEGAIKDKAPNFEKLKKFYYQIRNWDPDTGKPHINKLKELGLDNI